MNSYYYKYNDTDVYVLELKQSLITTPEVALLSDQISELLNEPNLTGVIIHQTDKDLKINSGGLGQLIRLVPKKAVTCNSSGKLKRILIIAKFDRQFKDYHTLEEAVESYY